MRGRSVVESMVVVFTVVVALCVLGLGAMVVFIEVRDPTADTDRIATLLMSLLSGIAGALIGLLAGKRVSTDELHHRDDGTTNGIG